MESCELRLKSVDQSMVANNLVVSGSCLHGKQRDFPRLLPHDSEVQLSTSRAIGPNRLTRLNMASIIRPTLLRQTCRTAVSKRVFSVKRPNSYQNPTVKTTTSILCRQKVRSAFVRDNIGTVRIAAFHASSRNAILPLGPRMSHIPLTHQFKLTFLQRSSRELVCSGFLQIHIAD